MTLPSRKRTRMTVEAATCLENSVHRTFEGIVQPFAFYTLEPHVLYSTSGQLVTEIEIGVDIDNTDTGPGRSRLADRICVENPSLLARLIEGNVLQLVLALNAVQNGPFFDCSNVEIECDESYACYVEPVILSCRKRKHLTGTSVLTHIQAKQKRTVVLFAFGTEITIQLAREHQTINALNTENSWPISNPCDIIRYAVGVGLLHDLALTGLPTGQSLASQRRIRVSWISNIFAGFTIQLQLICVVVPPMCPRRVHETISNCTSVQDIEVAFQSKPRWRIEVEFGSNITEAIFAHGVFFVSTIQRFLQCKDPQIFREAVAYRPMCVNKLPFQRALFLHLAHTDPASRIVSVGNTTFPQHRRPRDAPDGLREGGGKFVTAKVDGEEAFLLISNSTATVFTKVNNIPLPLATKVAGPVLFEGEWLSECNQFVVCDCLVTPRVNITTLPFHVRLQHWTSLASNLDPCIIFKPFFTCCDPFEATAHCLTWIKKSNVPCDGLIFISAEMPYWSNILTKVKFHPTIDFLILENKSLNEGFFQLMLRNDKYSLHSPLQLGNVKIPSVIACPSTYNNRVIEIAVSHQNGQIVWEPYKVRELGKLANYSSNVNGILKTVTLTNSSSENLTHLLQNIVIHSVHEFKNNYLSQLLVQIRAERRGKIIINDIGAGNGSNVRTWKRFSSIIEHVNLVEPNKDLLPELHQQGLTVVSTIHNTDYQRFASKFASERANWGKKEQGLFVLWVFSFSLTQVVRHSNELSCLVKQCVSPQNSTVILAHLYSDSDSFLDHSQGIYWGAISLNDDNIPSITLTVEGSRLAQQITESMITLDHIRNCCNSEKMVYQWSTTDPESHWLLRSLIGVTISNK